MDAPTVASIDDLTADWLTAAVGGPPVVDFSASRIGTGQMSDSYRVVLDYGGAVPGDAPASVVLKVAAEDASSRAAGAGLGLYEREVCFYRDLAPHIGGPLAPIYAAGFDAADNTFSLLMGDAAPARQGDEIAGASRAEAEAAARALAAIHGAVLDGEALAATTWLHRESPVNGELMRNLLGGWLDRYGDRVAPEHRHVCERLVGAFDAWRDLATAAPQGLVHGDFRLDNMLFADGSGTVTVVDWQTVASGDAFTDLAYLLGGALATEDRRALADELMAIYQAGLGPAAPALQTIQEGVRRQSFYGVMMAIISPMMVVRTDRGDDMFMAAVARHAQHALDLDALALLPIPVAIVPLAPVPEDERPHPAGPERLFNESWYFDVADPEQGIGAYVRLGKYPNLGSTWFTLLICGPDRPTVGIVDFHAPLPADDLFLQTEAFTVRHEFDVPLGRVRVVVTGTGQSHTDPAGLLRGEAGEPVAVELDLTWETDGTPYQYSLTTRYEIPCRVHGTLTVGDETFALDALGQRDHSWGVRDWWSMGWVWFAAHLDDGTRLHGTDLRLPGAPPIGIGYAQGTEAPIHELSLVRASETYTSDGLMGPARIRLQPGDIELEFEPLGHGPVGLDEDDTGRHVDFPRAWGTVRAADGRTGIAWIEGNPLGEEG